MDIYKLRETERVDLTYRLSTGKLQGSLWCQRIRGAGRRSRSRDRAFLGPEVRVESLAA